MPEELPEPYDFFFHEENLLGNPVSCQASSKLTMLFTLKFF
jgi:hypothetical protein